MTRPAGIRTSSAAGPTIWARVMAGAFPPIRPGNVQRARHLRLQLLHAQRDTHEGVRGHQDHPAMAATARGRWRTYSRLWPRTGSSVRS
jgi:hypothetical protein